MLKAAVFSILFFSQFAMAEIVAKYNCEMTSLKSGKVIASKELKAKKAHEGIAYSQELKAKEDGMKYSFGYSAVLNEGAVQAVIFSFVSRKNGDIVEYTGGGLGEDQDQSAYTLTTKSVKVICTKEEI